MAEELEDELGELDEDRDAVLLEARQAFSEMAARILPRLDSLPPEKAPPGYRSLSKRARDQTKTFVTGLASYIAEKPFRLQGEIQAIHGLSRYGYAYVKSDADGVEWCVRIPIHLACRWVTDDTKRYDSDVLRTIVELLPEGSSGHQAR